MLSMLSVVAAPDTLPASVECLTGSTDLRTTRTNRT